MRVSGQPWRVASRSHRRGTLESALHVANDFISDTIPPRRPRPGRGADRPRRRHRFGVPGESFLAVLDGFHEHRDRIRFIACRQEGGAGFMAEAQGKLSGRPGVCFVTRGPGATNAASACTPPSRTPRRWSCSSARSRATSATARPSRRSTTGRCSAPARSAWPSGSARCTMPTACPSTWRAPSTPRCRAGPGRWCWCCPRTCCDADRRAGAAAGRAGAGLAGARAPGATARAAAAAERPLVIAGGSGWTPAACGRCSASPRTGSCRWAARFRFQDTFDNRHPHYAGDVGIGINPKLAAARRARPTWCSRSARGWAR